AVRLIRLRDRLRLSIAAEQSREEPVAVRSRQAGDRDALMGGPHHAAPDVDRQAAAGDVFGRRAVVIAEPDAGDEIGRIADEPGVAEILARAGLAGGVPARQLGLARGT